MTKPILEALKGNVQKQPPFWLMRQAGRYLPEYRKIRSQASNFLDFCYTPEMAVEVALQPLRRYEMDAAILFADILVIPDAMGQKVTFEENAGPVLEPVRSVFDMTERLSLDNFHKKLGPVYENIERLSKKIPENVALIGFAGAPWTVATYMVDGRGSKDYAETRTWAYRDPDEFKSLVYMLVDATADYLIHQINAGAEAVQIFDSWAGILPETEFQRWVIEPTADLVRRIKTVHPETPIIGFPKDAGVLYERFVKETGVDGISLDSTVPVDWAANVLQPHCTVQGNLDNLALTVGGKMMEEGLEKIFDAFAKGPFIFNLGHGVVPQTPLENVSEMVNWIKAWPEGGRG